jgi:glycosyltransferase involved in cell wall biosynthesis
LEAQDGVSKPELTCIINVRNGAAFIEETLASAARQTVPIVLLVVDNHSTDGTAEIVGRFPLAKCVKTPEPMSLGAARNFSLSLLETEFVSWLDADDLWEPAFAERSVAALKRHPEATVVTSATLLIDAHGVLLPSRRQIFQERRVEGGAVLPGDNFEEIAFKMHPRGSWQSYAFRSAAVKSVGGFDLSLSFSPDLDIILKCLSVGRGLYIPENLSRCREHPNQDTRRLSAEVRFDEVYRVLARAGREFGFLKEDEIARLRRVRDFRISLSQFARQRSPRYGLRTMRTLLDPHVVSWLIRRLAARSY